MATLSFKMLAKVAFVLAAIGQWTNVCGHTTDGQAAEGKLWAVVVAGSQGYFNYRHQADVCHSYQILKSHGIPDEQIIVFMKDDIAYNRENKKPGVLINRPDGPNVYDGVPKDYTGKNYTTKNFFDVLAGRSTSTDGKTLKSGPNDNVFIFYSDHGAPGLSGFCDETLKATDLNKAIKDMHAAKMYKQMVIYWESCESGSMFNRLLPKDINVFATTAANPSESSYACYPDHGVFLGDVFSVRWMEDSDKEGDLSKETIKTQVNKVKKETTTSHVSFYGDQTMEGLKLNDFMGSTPEAPMKFKTQDCGVKIAQQDVPIYTYLELAWTSNDLDKADLYLNKARELQADRSEMEKVVMGLLTPYPPSWIRTNNTYTNDDRVSTGRLLLSPCRCVRSKVLPTGLQ